MFTWSPKAIGSVGVAGDWHVTPTWAEIAIERMSSETSTILHVGDFGLWPGIVGENYLNVVNSTLERNSMEILVTPGNHEDYDQLESLELDSTGRVRRSPKYPNILFMERGARWNFGDVSFLSLGGAASIDRDYRVKGVSWWEREAITDDDVKAAISGGEVDVMISHDAPTGVEFPGSHHSRALASHIQLYADTSRSNVKRVTDSVKPDLLFHGHYHMHQDSVTTLRVEGEYEFYELRSVCLEREYNFGNLALLDLTSREVNVIGVESA